MAASINLDFLFVYASKEDLAFSLAACKKYRAEEDFVALQEDFFVQLNDNYLLFRAGASMPYFEHNALYGYIDALNTKCLFSKCFLESEELDIEEGFHFKQKYHAEGQSILSSHQNKIDFSPYFKVAASTKVFQNEKKSEFTIETKKIELNNQSYIHFEKIPKYDFPKKLLLDNLLLSIENKAVIATFSLRKKDIILNKALQNVFKTLFVSDDVVAENRTFLYSEHLADNSLFYIEYQGQERITIGNKTYPDCIKLKHGVINKYNTFEWQYKGMADFFAQDAASLQTYWAKDFGIVRILSQNATETTAYNCISMAKSSWKFW
jgi:hypothetical protein